jgi:acyl-CoA reductase-like NAD-dependent aldehyde dehydrogenase
MNDVKLLIGGKVVQARSAATFERRNPVSGAVVTRSAAAAEADAIAAVDAAAAAFPAWSALGPGARRAKLNKAADLLEARAADFAAIVRDETGATAGWGHFNVHVAAGMLREAASMTSTSRSASTPEFVTSMARRFTTRPRCPSAA